MVSDTCTLHSTLGATETVYIADAVADDPPRKFTVVLCVEDMEGQYKILTGKHLGSELSEKEKGKLRVETAFTILMDTGILGKGKSSEEKVRQTLVHFTVLHARLSASNFRNKDKVWSMTYMIELT